MFRVWIGNLGKYNEGELVGEWVDLPCEDFDAVYERIGINFEEPINGTWYEEIFLADFENDYGYEVGEWDSLEALNDIADTLESLDEGEAEVYETLRSEGGYDHDDAIDIIESGDYTVWQDCRDMGEVAQEVYADVFEEVSRVSPLFERYFAGRIDWDGLGRDLACEGSFLWTRGTTTGFVEVIR